MKGREGGGWAFHKEKQTTTVSESNCKHSFTISFLLESRVTEGEVWSGCGNDTNTHAHHSSIQVVRREREREREREKIILYYTSTSRVFYKYIPDDKHGNRERKRERDRQTVRKRRRERKGNKAKN